MMYTFEYVLISRINPIIVNELEHFNGYNHVISKRTFGSSSLAETLSYYIEEQDVDSIELVGLCTDICVISNALIIKAFCPEIKIIVDASSCAGVTPESHKNALSAMKMCQIEIVNE